MLELYGGVARRGLVGRERRKPLASERQGLWHLEVFSFQI